MNSNADSDAKEKMYHCEVKKLFLRDGQKHWEWVGMPVSDAIRLDRELQTHEFRYFIEPWLHKAERQQPFEKLIHLWVAFNAWLAETIDDPDLMEKDWPQVNAAARDAELNTRFDDLLRGNREFKARAEEFQSIWPVFNVRRLYTVHIGGWEADRISREEYRNRCFGHPMKPSFYKPSCFLDHQRNPNDVTAADPKLVPLDWPHSLAAIYQVRCNLFHGGKTFWVESDVTFARLAGDILWSVWGAPFLRE